MLVWLRSLFAPKTPAVDISKAPAERIRSTRPVNQQGPIWAENLRPCEACGSMSHGHKAINDTTGQLVPGVFYIR
jgi:hypothetical protein